MEISQFENVKLTGASSGPRLDRRTGRRLVERCVMPSNVPNTLRIQIKKATTIS